MTNKYPRLRVHTRRRLNGKVATYYFYDNRGTGKPDVSLGSDHETALKRWKEIHHDAPRIVGTLEEAFGRWNDEVLPTYDNAETRKGYAKGLKKLRPVFGTATWESIRFAHLKEYLKRRSAKTQANRELSLLSVIWNWARGEDLTQVPWPAAGMERSRWKNSEDAREFEVTDVLFEAVYAEADAVLRDCMDVVTATGMRLTDVRTILLPAGDLLRLKANKTGKKVDFEISMSAVLPDLIARRRLLKADHLMLLSTPTGRPVSATMLRSRWDAARAAAAAKAEERGEDALAKEIRSMFLRDMRKRASDLADDLEGASKLLQHGSTQLTQRHYRTKATKLKPVR
jgi:hypothetical protein